MVYKTWSYHFSKNWHFYAIIAVLAVGVAYLSQRVYRLNKEISNRKTNRRRRDETRDHYSRDYDVEAGKSEFTEDEGEIIDNGEPLEVVTEKLKDDNSKESETNLNEDDFENIPDDEPEKTPETVEPEKKETPEPTEYPKCKTLIKSGKRKGEECGKPAMTGISTCRFHT